MHLGWVVVLRHAAWQLAYLLQRLEPCVPRHGSKMGQQGCIGAAVAVVAFL